MKRAAIIAATLLSAALAAEGVDPGSYTPASVAMGAAAPSGAVQLFDGTMASVNANWEMWPDASDSITWRLMPDPQTGTVNTLQTYGATSYGNKDLITKQAFGDMEGHCEFVMMGERNESDPDDTSGRSNSGVYFENCYELQIETPPSDVDPFTWSIGTHGIGAICKERVPDSNEWRSHGEWHVYHWVYRAARWDGSTQVEKARVKIWWNGVVIHPNIELIQHRGGGEADVPGLVGLKLQEHGRDVRYRNIWIKPLDDDNQAPAIDNGYPTADPNPVTGTTTTLSVSATDPDGDPLGYAWEATDAPGGAAPGIGSGQNPTVTFDMAGHYVFTVTVSDGRASTSGSVAVAVEQTPTDLAIVP